LKDFPVR